jgi:hypothetical protein
MSVARRELIELIDRQLMPPRWSAEGRWFVRAVIAAMCVLLVLMFAAAMLSSTP